ncbi:unnamed protein product [Phytomonas sp. EM1]|nr:unnamed protein product [Phytomonas sp. EM1]|eukprot:CCW63443.1 unnamed protein product [Phytomonas sp. isolate EM1]
MGRRKAKAQAKYLPQDAVTSEDNLSSRPDPNDLEDALEQPPREGANGAEAEGTADSNLDDDKQNSEDAENLKLVKKKEYKGNKLNKIQGKKQKEAKQLSGANDGSSKRVVNNPGFDGNQSDREDSIENGKDATEPAHKAPIEVLYCPFCTFPAEMCEFGGMMDKCRPWLLEHAPEFADADNLGRKRRILTEKEHIEAMIAGKGIKKALERRVVLEVGKRAGARKTTTITGMDLFGFNLKDLSKEWRKTFSCGVGVREAAEGAYQDCIDIQGDILTKLVDILLNKYQIPKEAIYHIVNKKNVRYFDDIGATKEIK